MTNKRDICECVCSFGRFTTNMITSYTSRDRCVCVVIVLNVRMRVLKYGSYIECCKQNRSSTIYTTCNTETLILITVIETELWLLYSRRGRYNWRNCVNKYCVFIVFSLSFSYLILLLVAVLKERPNYTIMSLKVGEMGGKLGEHDTAIFNNDGNIRN